MNTPPPKKKKKTKKTWDSFASSCSLILFFLFFFYLHPTHVVSFVHLISLLDFMMWRDSFKPIWEMDKLFNPITGQAVTLSMFELSDSRWADTMMAH